MIYLELNEGYPLSFQNLYCYYDRVSMKFSLRLDIMDWITENNIGVGIIEIESEAIWREYGLKRIDEIHLEFDNLQNEILFKLRWM